MYRRIVHPKSRLTYHLSEDIFELWEKLIPVPVLKDKLSSSHVWAFTEYGWKLIGERTFLSQTNFSVIEIPEFVTKPYDEVQVCLLKSELEADKKSYNKKLRQEFLDVTTILYEGNTYPFVGIFAGNLYCGKISINLLNLEKVVIEESLAELTENSSEVTSENWRDSIILSVFGKTHFEIVF